MKTSKQTKLNEVLKGFYTQAQTTGITQQETKDPAENTKESQSRTNSRTGKKAITGFFEEEVSIQLKQLALEKRCTLQHLLKEAFNDLFLKYNKAPIA